MRTVTSLRDGGGVVLNLKESLEIRLQALFD